MKIGIKLLTGFIVVALIAGVVGVIGIMNISVMTESGAELYDVNISGLEMIANAAIDFQKIRVEIGNMMYTNNDNQSADQIKELYKSLEEHIDDYGKLAIHDEDKRIYGDISETLKQYKIDIDNLMTLLVANQNQQEIDRLFKEANTLGNSIDASFFEILDFNEQSAKKTSNNNKETARQADIIMISVITIAIIVAIGLGVFVSRSITLPIKKMVAITDKIAQGDLNVTIDINTKDEIGALAKALKHMVEKTNEVMTNIHNTAEQVAAGAVQVSSSSQVLSQGATEQASSIEELTASIEEIAAQTKQNAANASLANESGLISQSAVVHGTEEMKEMLKAMDEINEASSRISKIIKVIDEIAFQTNILALNAAVEAARAGQHGKGFAVVAEEVRNLAARSADAAKETTALIEGALSKVEAGTKMANNTSNALSKIEEGIAKEAVLVGEIAIASNEQATAINQINQGIMEVSKVVQENSATSEESAAASEELSAQAEYLKNEVNKFKLKNETGNKKKLEGLSPEMIKMLEEMVDAKDRKKDTVKKDNVKKIVLSDDEVEFGKYS